MSLALLENSGNRREVSLDAGDIAKAAIDQVRAARRCDITFQREDDLIIEADAREVHQAIVNLIANGAKYSSDEPVHVTAVEDGRFVVLRVHDRGPGMPAHERHHIFERFFRGDGARGIDGSGLGLSIVARATSRNGGTLALESGEPGSTTFALRFPKAL